MLGTSFGPYRVTGHLGRGGMGDVYRAHDDRLGRDVALKVLPPEFTADADRLMRFEREAKTLAALNHPHISQIYGFEQSGEASALVMELVEGEDLAQRIACGPMPPDEALPIAKQIAEALEAAHEQGIIHRDLKPANIKVRADGTVKVLDFGLAKALQGPSSERQSSSLTIAATITSPAVTAAGLILGTAAYMSPEQAKGKIADKRADIWAFGCVLYEMLTGRRAFPGDGVTETLAAVIKTDPDWSELPAATPSSIRRLLSRALQKDHRRRLGDIHDARLELDEAGEPATNAPYPAARSRPYLPWIVVAVLALLLSVVAYDRWFRTDTAIPSSDIVRFEIPPPPGGVFSLRRGTISLSPDGQHVAFVAGDLPGAVHIRPLASVSATPLSQVSGLALVAAPVWSRDGRSVIVTAGSLAGGPVRRLELGGGPVTTLTDWGRSAIWGRGVVVFTGRDGNLHRIPETGGAPQPISTLDAAAGETAHMATTFLPDGERFVFTAVNRDSDKTANYVSSIGGEQRTRIAGVTARAEYAAGYLWFIEGPALVARRFDASTLQLGDIAHQVADNVSDFAVAANGTLVTRPREQESLEMAWLDNNGQPQAVTGPAGSYRNVTRPDLAPDGRTLAFSRRDASGNVDIWTLDLERNVASRLTSDRGDEEAPIYSPDGKWIVFASSRSGVRDLYRRAADGSGSDELIFASTVNKYPTGFAPDGGSLLFFHVVPNTGADIWMLPVTGTRQAVPLLVTSALDGYATISPDGKWIAYCSGEQGEGDEVYIQPYPLTGSRIRLSTAGGQSPQWSASGREVYYGTWSGEIMRVPLTFSGGTVRPAVPQLVMKAPSLFSHSGFVLDRARSRILSLATSPTTITAPLTVTLNWPALLRTQGNARNPR